MSSDSAAVVPHASGNRKHYALDPHPIARGGQATVYGATHKPSGRRVAFKRVEGRNVDRIARMKREIEAAQLFGDHPNVMPVLDFSPTFVWFVMPLAGATAQTAAQELSQTESLRELVGAICAALRLPHQQGWIHRDLKPDNLLRLDGRWVVADWGLGRRPRGLTSDPRRTRTGTAFGTEGFAAPELAVDAHAAGPQADIYSIGQIIGWAVTGSWPRANMALLPSGGPWRAIVKATTWHDVERRLASVDDLLATMASELETPDAVILRGRELLAEARAGDADAPVRLFRLAAGSGETEMLLHEGGILDLHEEQVRAAIAADPSTAIEVVRLLRAQTVQAPVPDPARLRAITWLLTAAHHAEHGELWDLLDETVETLFVVSGPVVDDGALTAMTAWVGSRTGQAASSLAIALRRLPVHPKIRKALSGDPSVDYRIRRALRAGPAAAHPVARQRWPRWVRTVLVPVGVVVLLAASIAFAIPFLNLGSSGTPSGSQSNPFVGLPKKPGELATFAMDDFVAPWNDYPTWTHCRSGSGDTDVTGSFPAHRDTAITPTKSIYCDNGGNLVVMFGEFPADDYERVRGRYFAAKAPAKPVHGESNPPGGLHVFAWSATHRAIVWTDPENHLIGLLITDSPNTDLVELWNRYEGPA